MSVLIVGAGIFGSVIAAKLTKEGHLVTLFDDHHSEAGSPPSGGHLKPSWLTSIHRKELESSMQTLQELYGLETLSCKFGPKTVELYRVDVDTVLSGPCVIEAQVNAVGDGYIEYSEPGTPLLNCRRSVGTIIVAAGIWSGHLLPQIAHRMTGKKGMSFTYKTDEILPNIISPWAPYKQVVRTAHGPGQIWIGDGTAIKTENWGPHTEAKIIPRIEPHAPKVFSEMLVQRGIRPYITGNGLEQLGRNLWVATGGGKSGMALAGVYANKLAEALR